jgi:uncharacterized protein YqiB (DUF1249 family)
MLSDALCRVSWRARPGAFVSLMTLYESNYIRLGWLVEDLGRLADRSLSHVPGDCDLELKVRERSPYTTTLVLTYLFAEGDLLVADPALEVRVYHDARLVEARGAAREPAHDVVRRIRSQALGLMATRGLDHRWARNVMLNKWLEYCVERGHRFSRAAT